jgi:hypothetical protein
MGVGVVGGCKGGCGEWVEEGVEEVVWINGKEQGRGARVSRRRRFNRCVKA